MNFTKKINLSTHLTPGRSLRPFLKKRTLVMFFTKKRNENSQKKIKLPCNVKVQVEVQGRS
jgi:hypothetical protein